MAFTLNYPAAVYQNKISELLGYRDSLNQHLENLKGYQQQIRQYWDDEHGQNYYEMIGEQILAVQRANNRIESLVHIYEEAVGDFSIVKSAFNSVIEDARSVIAELG